MPSNYNQAGRRKKSRPTGVYEHASHLVPSQVFAGSIQHAFEGTHASAADRRVQDAVLGPLLDDGHRRSHLVQKSCERSNNQSREQGESSFYQQYTTEWILQANLSGPCVRDANIW